jgi:hypothetical protein
MEHKSLGVREEEIAFLFLGFFKKEQEWGMDGGVRKGGERPNLILSQPTSRPLQGVNPIPYWKFQCG